jgi:tryptophan-rich sensory protein
MEGMREYAMLSMPNLTPPAWLFPVVWTILFILMGIGVARVYIKTGTIPGIYILQLIFNFFWPIIFFNLGAYFFAFIWLIALLGLVIIMTIQFYRVDKLAGLIQIPYILWLIFAGYLNFMVYVYFQ